MKNKFQKSDCNKCNKLFDAYQTILNSLDVGGEQSRQFANEIKCLKKILRESKKQDCKNEEAILTEQNSESPIMLMKVKIINAGGQVWIQPKGYGDKTSQDGHGYPISLEIWKERLRLIVFNDINSENPQIIDLENAKETNRIEE